MGGRADGPRMELLLHYEYRCSNSCHREVSTRAQDAIATSFVYRLSESILGHACSLSSSVTISIMVRKLDRMCRNAIEIGLTLIRHIQ